MIDAHVHIERGPYTLEWIKKFTEQAVKMGISELYLLEHSHRFVEFAETYSEVVNYNEYQKNWYTSRTGLSLQSFISLAEEYRNSEEGKNPGLKVKWGLEVCYLPGVEKVIEKLKSQNVFDFFTGSVHWINGWGFDHKKEFWADKNTDEVYKAYFAAQKRLIKSQLFSHLAHPDSIKCFNHYPAFNLEETYDEIISEARKTGIKFEQSCGLFNNYGHGKIGLEDMFLKKLVENKIEIITASDAHCPEDVGKNIAAAEKMIKNAQLQF